MEIKNIICTTDFSDFSKHSVNYGVELAKKFGAKLYLCYVIHIPHSAIYSISVSDSQTRQTQLIENVHKQAGQLLRHQSVN